MLRGLHDVAIAKKEPDWNLQMGPAPGVKYRGGTPPGPPTWSYGKMTFVHFRSGIGRLKFGAYKSKLTFLQTIQTKLP